MGGDPYIAISLLGAPVRKPQYLACILCHQGSCSSFIRYKTPKHDRERGGCRRAVIRDYCVLTYLGELYGRFPLTMNRTELTELISDPSWINVLNVAKYVNILVGSIVWASLTKPSKRSFFYVIVGTAPIIM